MILCNLLEPSRSSVFRSPTNGYENLNPNNIIKESINRPLNQPCHLERERDDLCSCQIHDFWVRDTLDTRRMSRKSNGHNNRHKGFHSTCTASSASNGRSMSNNTHIPWKMLSVCIFLHLLPNLHSCTYVHSKSMPPITNFCYMVFLHPCLILLTDSSFIYNLCNLPESNARTTTCYKTCNKIRSSLTRVNTMVFAIPISIFTQSQSKK